MRKVILTDAKVCTGCRLCEMVCSLEHEGFINPSLSRIRIIKWEEEGIDIPMVCLQCKEPLCVDVCPVRAIDKDMESGMLKTDASRCIQCYACITICPFGGSSINNEGVVVRCDQCNGEPMCVEVCEKKALSFVREEDLSLMKQYQMAQSLKKYITKEAP